ncbi:SAM-dependent methyltransferase [Litchfieldella rifensis]|uniref:SAM-dependent methyltransferase n=1 Tax=Litchfieldella rifensis TaxID=762643 RepID=A0ABV7LIW4_9GAMM
MAKLQGVLHSYSKTSSSSGMAFAKAIAKAQKAPSPQPVTHHSPTQWGHGTSPLYQAQVGNPLTGGQGFGVYSPEYLEGMHSSALNQGDDPSRTPDNYYFTPAVDTEEPYPEFEPIDNVSEADTPDADELAADVSGGKSLDLVAEENELSDRDEAIAELEAGGYDVSVTEEDGVRITEITRPETDETITETVRPSDDEGEVVTIETTGGENDHPTVVIDEEGHRTELDTSQETTRESVDEIAESFSEGKELGAIADELGITEEQLTAQLLAAGFKVADWEQYDQEGNYDGRYREIYSYGDDKEIIAFYDDRKSTVSHYDPRGHENGGNGHHSYFIDSQGRVVKRYSTRPEGPLVDGGLDIEIIVDEEGVTTRTITDNGETTREVSRNDRTVITDDDGNITLRDDESGDEVAIEDGEVSGDVNDDIDEAMLEAIQETDLDGEDGEIFQVFIDAWLNRDSWLFGGDEDSRADELREDYNAREREMEDAVEEYGENSDEAQEALRARDIAYAAWQEAAYASLVRRATLEFYAVDPDSEEAMRSSMARINEILNRHGMEWSQPDSQLSPEEASERLEEAERGLELAREAKEELQEAERLLDEANSALEEGRRGLSPGEIAGDNSAELAQVAVMFSNFEVHRAKGDDRLSDFDILHLERLLEEVENNPSAYEGIDAKEVDKYLDQAKRRKKNTEEQLARAESQHDVDIARLEAAEIREQIADEYIEEYVDENGTVYRYDGIFGQHSGEYKGYSFNDARSSADGGVWIDIHYENTTKTVNVAPADDALDAWWENNRNADLIRQWHEAIGRLGATSRAAGRVGVEHSATRINTLRSNLSELEGDLEEQERAVGPPSVESPEGAPPEHELVEIGGKIQVPRPVAERYAQIGVEALEKFDLPARVLVDDNNNPFSHPEWRWVERSELAGVYLELQETKDRLTVAEQSAQRDAQQAVWRARLPGESEEEYSQRAMYDSLGGDYQQRTLDDFYQSRFEEFFADPTFNAEYERRGEGELGGWTRQALGVSGGRIGNLDKVLEQIRDHGGNNPEVKAVPLSYVGLDGNEATIALVAVKSDDGDVHYVDATGRDFRDLEDFSKHNRQFNANGRLVAPTNLEMTPGRDENIPLEVVDVRAPDMTLDNAVNYTTMAATGASFIPGAAPVALPLAVAGGIYIGARSAYNQWHHVGHGGDWYDTESLLNYGSIASAALPMAASSFRFAGMAGHGVDMTVAARTSIGAVNFYSRNPVYWNAAESFKKGGRWFESAHGLDVASLTIDVPQIFYSAAYLNRNHHQMSDREFTEATTNLAIGVFGAGMSIRGLQSSWPGEGGTEGTTQVADGSYASRHDGLNDTPIAPPMSQGFLKRAVRQLLPGEGWRDDRGAIEFPFGPKKNEPKGSEIESRGEPQFRNKLTEYVRLTGGIPFAEFMEYSLYGFDGEGGYYNSGVVKIGDVAENDFITAPERSKYFGRTIARSLVDMYEAMGRPLRFDVVEMGAGNGTMAHDILEKLQTDHPDLYESLHYIIVERSQALIKRQQEALTEQQGVRWLHASADALPLRNIRGVFLSNELPDAFPVHRVLARAGKFKEIYVTVDERGHFVEEVRNPSSALAAALPELGGLFPPSSLRYDEQLTVNARSINWMRRLGDALEEGYVLTIDYGQPAATKQKPYVYYRNTGPIETAYEFPGEIDITSHVDNLLLSQIGSQVGLEPATSLGAGVLDSQHAFLEQHGLREELSTESDDRLRADGQRLLGDDYAGFFALVQEKRNTAQDNSHQQRQDPPQSLSASYHPEGSSFSERPSPIPEAFRRPERQPSLPDLTIDSPLSLTGTAHFGNSDVIPHGFRLETTPPEGFACLYRLDDLETLNRVSSNGALPPGHYVHVIRSVDPARDGTTFTLNRGTVPRSGRVDADGHLRWPSSGRGERVSLSVAQAESDRQIVHFRDQNGNELARDVNANGDVYVIVTDLNQTNLRHRLRGDEGLPYAEHSGNGLWATSPLTTSQKSQPENQPATANDASPSAPQPTQEPHKPAAPSATEDTTPSIEQLSSLSGTQLNSISPSELAQAATQQFRQLRSDQLAAFTELQWNALRKPQLDQIDTSLLQQHATRKALKEADRKGTITKLSVGAEGPIFQLHGVDRRGFDELRRQSSWDLLFFRTKRTTEITENPDGAASTAKFRIDSGRFRDLGFLDPQAESLLPKQSKIIEIQVHRKSHPAPDVSRNSKEMTKTALAIAIASASGSALMLPELIPIIPQAISQVANTMAYGLRGASFIIRSRFPAQTAPDTNLGRNLRLLEIATTVVHFTGTGQKILEGQSPVANVMIEMAYALYSSITFLEAVTGKTFTGKKIQDIWRGLTGREYKMKPDDLGLQLYFWGSATPLVVDGLVLSGTGGWLAGAAATSGLVGGVLFSLGSLVLYRNTYMASLVARHISKIMPDKFVFLNSGSGVKEMTRSDFVNVVEPPWWRFPSTADRDFALFIGGGLLSFSLWSAMSLISDFRDQSNSGSDETEDEESEPDSIQSPLPSVRPSPSPTATNVPEASPSPTPESTPSPSLLPDQPESRSGGLEPQRAALAPDGLNLHVNSSNEGVVVQDRRTDPALESQGYLWVEVLPGQSLGSIAVAHGYDVVDVAMLNMGHIGDLTSLKAGDRVYLPDTAQTSPLHDERVTA